MRGKAFPPALLRSRFKPSIPRFRCHHSPLTTHHSLNGHVVHRSIFLIVAALALVVLVLISAGCTSRSSAVDQPAEVSAGSEDQSHELDLGVLFSQRESCFCYPLRQFGIENADDVIRIDSSCDCVTAEVVDYVNASNRPDSGLSICVTPDKGATAAASLIVELNLILTNSPSVPIRLRFLTALRSG